MNLSPLQKASYQYVPKLPGMLRNGISDICVKEGSKTQSVADQEKIEKLFPNGQRGTGVDVKSLGPKLNMQNVFGCYLSSHVRKIRHGRFFPTYTSSIDDYANMYRALYTRLLRYKSMRPNCLIEIRIYEGENANEADKKYAETDYVQRRWPIKAEEFYK